MICGRLLDSVIFFLDTLNLSIPDLFSLLSECPWDWAQGLSCVQQLMTSLPSLPRHSALLSGFPKAPCSCKGSI